MQYLSRFRALMVSATFFAAACGAPTTTQTAPPGNSTTSPSAMVAFDQQFIDMMVPHHTSAVEMARIAETRSQRPEITSLAAEIVRSQGVEIEQMKGWRRAWYGSDQTPPMNQMPTVEGMGSTDNRGGMAGHNMGGGGAAAVATMDMAKEVEDLRKAPEPFDRAFIDAMVAHHESAIAAGRAAEGRAQRQEIKELAQAIIRDQEREIAQMKGWRRAWFPG